jgi:hypothetical protein
MTIGGNYGAEDIALEIIQTTPSDQQKALLDMLYEQRVLYPLVKGIDGSNFQKFIDTLVNWILVNYPWNMDNDLTSKLASKEYLLFNDNFFGRLNDEEINKTGDVSLTVNTWTNQTEYKIRTSPYEYLLVTFKNNFEIGGNKFLKGETYKLPALYVYMLFNEDTREKWIQVGKTTIDVGLLALGVGEIKAALTIGNWARIAVAVTDIGIGFTDIIINDGFKNEIQGRYPGFYEDWQKISLAYGLGRLTQVGLEAAYRNVRSQSRRISIDTSLSPEARQTANKIQQKLDDPNYFNAEFLDDVARGRMLLDDTYNLQRSVVGKNKDIIAKALRNEKGAFGEIASDTYLTEKGYKALHNRKTALSQGWGETGIDGVFVKDGQYYIVEAKYHGSATLNMTNDGLQMSDAWIKRSNRLFNAVDGNIYRDINEVGYKRLLAEVAPDGTIVYKELDATAKEIGIFIP